MVLACVTAVLAGTATRGQNPSVSTGNTGGSSGANKPTIIGTPPTPTTDTSGNTPAGYSPFLPVAGGSNSEAARLQRQQLLLVQFQKKNLKDAERLLALAKELDSTSATPNRTKPTAEEVKKVEEIEKIAKRVKDRLAVP